MSGIDVFLRCHLSAAFSQTCFDMCLLMNRGSIFCKFNLTPKFMILNANERTFAPFSLTRLLTTCFGRGNGEKVCILIDLPNPADIKDFKFLEDETLSIQNYELRGFLQGFQKWTARRDELDGRRNLCL